MSGRLKTEDQEMKKRQMKGKRRRLRFSNVIETICPSESSESSDRSSDSGIIASAKDNGGHARTSMTATNSMKTFSFTSRTIK